MKPATLRAGVALVLLVGFAWCAGHAIAQSGPPPAGATSRTPTAVRPATKPEEGPRWQKLRPAQRDALKPLQQEWAGIDASSKQKWVQLADRMPDMHADERSRVQDRMSDWAKLTPAERGQARLRYQEAKQVPPSDRRSRWDDYQALPPEQKNELAARAAAARKGPSIAHRGEEVGFGRGDRSSRDGPQAKSNIVPNPAYSAPPRPIGPTVIQASPGATTTLVTRRPTPPAHQQTGLPKIAATPEFVNKSTLLPQRGPQGAAVRPAGEPPAQPRR
ncbi:MAG: DUF3106 domain-containing protein [Caldimonas sp.]